MFEPRQAAILVGAGVLFWLGDVALIRLVPALFADPFWGDAAFLASIPAAWICVAAARRGAALGAAQRIPGVALLVFTAALCHAATLRWAPLAYGGDHLARLGGAWLLWIYGLILAFALPLRGRGKASLSAT